jgi:hypothetical protein
MSKENDSIFPDTPQWDSHVGLTKRELFAAIIMQSSVADGCLYSAEERAEHAVYHADKLIAELRK